MKTFLERGYLTRRTIGADHELFLLIVKRIERMKELFLCAFLAGHKLHVIDQQHVNRAILLAKALRLIVTNSVDKIVHETLRRYVAEFEMLIASFDGVAA